MEKGIDHSGSSGHRMEFAKDPTGPSGSIKKEPDRKPEDAAESLRYTRRETLSEVLIGSAKTPRELYMGYRQLVKRLEDAIISQNLNEKYSPAREMAMISDRAENLSHSIDEMKKEGWITKYNPQTGEAKLTDRQLEGLAIYTEQTDKADRRNPFSPPDVKYYFGTENSRAELNKAYERVKVEFSARDILGDHVGLRLGIEVRDSLESLVAILHGSRFPKFKPEHLHALFNMPSVAELASNPENKLLGDMVEEAIFLNLVMLNSGNKQRMKDFLDRPGAKHLIARLKNKAGITYDKWVEINIGKVDKWVEDKDRLLDDKEGTASWRIEAADGRRGALTKWSNISAWAGRPNEFSQKEEQEFITNTIGGLVGGGKEGIEASWVAAAIMRGIGAYASEGYVALPNGESLLPLGEGRFISGDDTGKFWAYMFTVMKEGKLGRTSGLKGMIGRFPDLAMNLFDWAQVEVPDLPKDDPAFRRRSIWDAWLGTPGGKPKVDLLTGKKSTDPKNVTKEEPYHKLGNLEFKSLEREFHATFTIMQWLMGNGGQEGPLGVFIDGTSEEFKEEEFKLNKLKKKWKYIDIVMNPVILTKGSIHLYDLGRVTETGIKTLDLTEEGVGKINTHVFKTTGAETIKRRFFRNLMASKFRGENFIVDILPKQVEVLNTRVGGGAPMRVPLFNLIYAYVNEVAKPIPPSEDGVWNHYFDDLTRYQKMVSWDDAIKNWTESAKWFTSEVGRLTGRKS